MINKVDGTEVNEIILAAGRLLGPNRVYAAGNSRWTYSAVL